MLPAALRKMLELTINQSYTFTDLLKRGVYQVKNLDEGIQLKVPPSEALMLSF
jgi:hypothetical protein